MTINLPWVSAQALKQVMKSKNTKVFIRWLQRCQSLPDRVLCNFYESRIHLITKRKVTYYYYFMLVFIYYKWWMKICGEDKIVKFQTKSWNLMYPSEGSGNVLASKILWEGSLDMFSEHTRFQIVDVLAYKADGKVGRCYLPIDMDFAKWHCRT